MVLLNFFMRYIVVAIVAVAAVVTAYELGQSKGHTKGFNEAWNQQQAAINKMVTDQNAATEEQNRKISQLELSAMTANEQVQAAQQQAAKARSDAVTAYKKANPVVARSCGWSPATIQTINQLLENRQ